MSETSGTKWKSKEHARMIFFISVLLLCLIAVASVPRVSAPLLLSYVISLMLRPFLPFFTRLGVPRAVSIFVLLLGVIAATTVPIVKVVPVISEETQNLQYTIPKVETYIQEKYLFVKKQLYNRVGFDLNDAYLYDFLDSSNKMIRSTLLALPKFLATLLEWVFLVPLFAFFILKDGHIFRDLMLNICPNSLFERFYSLTHEFSRKIGGYIFAKIVEASIVFLIITIGLLILDIRFAFLLGLVAGVTNIIPYVGPVIGAVPALVFALAEYGAGTELFAIVLLYSIANAIDIAIVFPILVSRIVDLHPLLVVVSVILGSQSLGVVGMVISIPVAAALKLIILEIYHSIYARR